MVKIKVFHLGVLDTACIILYDDKDALIFDASGEFNVIDNFLFENNLTPKKIYQTHGHFDHIGAIKQLKDKYNIPVYINKNDEGLYHRALESSDFFALKSYIPPTDPIDFYIEDNNIIEFSNLKIKVLATPGHTSGCVCFYIEELSTVITGDTLFYRTVGRTDLEDSIPELIAPSIINKLYTLPDNTLVIPGHDSTTTIGYEKKNNMNVTV